MEAPRPSLYWLDPLFRLSRSTCHERWPHGERGPSKLPGISYFVYFSILSIERPQAPYRGYQLGHVLNLRCPENSNKPCDTGSNIETISSEFPDIDFSSVDPIYPEKVHPPSNPYAFTRRAVVARGKDRLRALYRRPEKVIAVVSHSGFLRCAISHTKYENADYRIFDFMEPTDDAGETVYEMKEWETTEEHGGGMGKSEKGRADIKARDFPPEEKAGEVMESVEEDLGEKAQGEAAREVPK